MLCVRRERGVHAAGVAGGIGCLFFFFARAARNGTKKKGRHQRDEAERESAWQEWFPSPLQRMTAGTDGDLLDPLVTFFRRRMQGARK